MASLLRWVSAHGSNIPSNAIQGGQEADGRPLFVARAVHNGYWCPGKAGYHLNGCHTGSNWQEKAYSNYEVLTLPPEAEVLLRWEKAYAGHIPANSICVDSSREQYVGRHEHAGGLHPGRVDPMNKSIYVPCDWKEHQYENYDVLVTERLDPSRYKLYNVRYDFGRAKVNMDDKPIIIASQLASNNSDLESQIKSIVSYAKTTSHQWNSESGMKVGVALEVSAGIPSFAETKCTASVEQSFNSNTGETVEERVEASAEAMVKLSPNSTATVSIVAKKQDVVVPYIASMTKIMPDGRTHTTDTAGVYKGVTYADFQTTIEN